MIRYKREEGVLWLCADDLAAELLGMSDDLSADKDLTPDQRKTAAYLTERIALSIVGGNLKHVNLVGDLDT